MTRSHPLPRSPREAHACSWGRLAESHLLNAWRLLDADPPDRRAAITHVMAAIRASLRAFLAWDGSAPEAPDPAPLEAVDGADLHRLGGRAVRLSSVLKTEVHRALLFADRAPALARSAFDAVTDREDVEAGWYAARDLWRAVLAELPASFRPPAREEPRESEAEIDAEIDASFPASDPPSWMP